MRIRSVNYWLNQIVSADEENIKTKERANTEDLHNYKIAEYYASKTESTKVA